MCNILIFTVNKFLYLKKQQFFFFLEALKTNTYSLIFKKKILKSNLWYNCSLKRKAKKINKGELIVLEPKSSLSREHGPPYTAGNMHIMH